MTRALDQLNDCPAPESHEQGANSMTDSTPRPTHSMTQQTDEHRPLDGKVALVAGATRGAGRGTAVALGEAGATVYCTGRTTRKRRSEYDRPETIEETAELVTATGGVGIAMAVDHLDAGAVEALMQRIDADSGRLDVLVNDIWGGEKLFEWNTPVWKHDLAAGLRILRLAIDTHLITSHFALPLLIREPNGLVVEMTDGTREYNAEHYRNSTFYDLAKTAVIRLAFAQSKELAPHGCSAVALTPGWMRSEMMLDNYGVTEANWRDGAAINPHFAAISESPRFVGRAVAALAADPDLRRRSGGSYSSGELAQEYDFTDVDGSQPDCWRYLVEIQDAGKPADPTGYR
jgi:NAD(P)-dependent dehydrogenase (short-subunit alcohol dehydrogenase family)